METFNRCLICRAEVCEGSFNNLKLCQKFVTLASRYYNIDFPINWVNLHKTLELNQLKSDNDSAQFVSCDNCFEKINSFCKIYKELSLLQIHLNASARKITQLMKDVQLTKPLNSIENNIQTSESRSFDYFRNQFYSKVAQQLPHVKLRRLEIYNVSIFKQENDQFYSPMENENSGNEDESDNAQMDHIHDSTDSCDAVPPPPPTNSGTEKSHRAKKFGKVKVVERFQEEASTEFENLIVDSSSIGAGNTVEMLKSLPQGSVLIVPGTTTDQERRHKCRFCEKTFETKRNKDHHEHIHLQKYRCRFCNRRFSFKFRMKVHERTHTGIKPFKCSVCAETFREKRPCTNHVWLVHKGNAEVIEDLNYEQENNLLESKIERDLVPIKATPNSEDAEKPFKCPICLKGFSRGKTLSDHKRIHKKPSFNCDICGAAFSEKWKLENHKISHTGQRPYLCPICFRTFSRHGSCKIHQRNIHKITNGVVINTKVSGVKVVRANDLSLETPNQNVAPGNQPEQEMQTPEKLPCTNSEDENFILPDTEQEFEMDLNGSGVKIVDTKLADPLGDL